MMTEPHIVGALRSKRAEVSGLIADLERRVVEHRSMLVHVDAVLRLYAPEFEPETIAPRPTRRRNDWFRPGELVRLVHDILRVAPAPLGLRAIVTDVMTRRGLDAADARTAHLTRKLVSNVLRRQSDTLEKLGAGSSSQWRVRE